MVSNEEQPLTRQQALDLALKVSEAVGRVNRAIEDAHQAGLIVKIEQLPAQAIGRRYPRPILSVEISELLYRS